MVLGVLELVLGIATAAEREAQARADKMVVATVDLIVG